MRDWPGENYCAGIHPRIDSRALFAVCSSLLRLLNISGFSHQLSAISPSGESTSFVTSRYCCIASVPEFFYPAERINPSGNSMGKICGLVLIIILALLISSSAQSGELAGSRQPRLMPWPSSVKFSSGQFLITPTFSVGTKNPGDARLEKAVAIFLNDL